VRSELGRRPRSDLGCPSTCFGRSARISPNQDGASAAVRVSIAWWGSSAGGAEAQHSGARARAASHAASAQSCSSRPRHVAGARRAAVLSARWNVRFGARSNSEGERRSVSCRRVFDSGRSRPLHHRSGRQEVALERASRARDSSRTRREWCARHQRASLGRSLSRARLEDAARGAHGDRVRPHEREEAPRRHRLGRRCVLFGAVVRWLRRSRRAARRTEPGLCFTHMARRHGVAAAWARSIRRASKRTHFGRITAPDVAWLSGSRSATTRSAPSIRRSRAGDRGSESSIRPARGRRESSRARRGHPSSAKRAKRPPTHLAPET